MSRDLTLLLVVIALTLALVGLGLRRNLSETTREWLPRFGEDSEQATVMAGPPGEPRGRQLSPRQRLWLAGGYVLISLGNATLALLSADGRLLHTLIAAGGVISAALLVLKEWPPSVDGPIS